MDIVKRYAIPYKGLSIGTHHFEFEVDVRFFDAFEGSEIHRGHASVSVELVKTERLLTLDFTIDGEAEVTCDRCLDDMELPIEAQERMEAKFGEESSEDDACVTVAEDEGILDVAWLIYELTALAIPVRHVHAPGKCNPAMIRVLEEHSAVRSGEGDEKATDPRWAALEQLKKKN